MQNLTCHLGVAARLRPLAALIALALASGLRPEPARATIGPPVKITMPADTKQAVRGQAYHGVFLVHVPQPGGIDDVAVHGEGWTVTSVERPRPEAARGPGVIAVPFQAIPNDPDSRIHITVTYEGRKVTRSYNLGPSAFERRSKGRAGLQAVPGTQLAPRAGGVQDPVQAAADSTTLRFTGRIVYTRPSAVNGDGTPVWTNATDEGVDGIWVEVMDEDAVFDETIWSGYTDENGYFDTGDIDWDDCDATGCDRPDLYLRWECDTPHVNVQDANDILEEDYSWSTASNVIDDFEGSVYNFGTWKPADLSLMAPLHIHNSITRAHRYILLKSGTGISVEEVDVQWPDSGDNAYYVSFFEEIFISPAREWEEGSHTHEYGHHFLENYAINTGSDYCNGICDDDEKCRHCRWCEETPNDAWNEGWPNWLGDVVTRDYPFSYVFNDGTPYQALLPRSLETLAACNEDGLMHDPLKTEGFLGALLCDIDDDTQDEHDNDGDGNVDVDGITDCLALGVDEIFAVTTSATPPTSPAEFIILFVQDYPQHRNAFWSTAFNVHPSYTSPALFGIDTSPPGVVQAVSSSSHPLGVGGTLPCISLEWASPPDDVTGACAYSIEWGTSPGGIEPDTTEEITASCASLSQGPFGLGEHYISIRARDCAGNWSPQWATFGPFTVTECNGNGIPDVCDISCFTSGWSNQVSCTVPETFCTPYAGCGSDADCNGNLVPDQCDIDGGASQDCNSNNTPDECETLFHWAGGSGSWHVASNWTENLLPGNGDHACIDDPLADVTVTYTAGTLSLVTLACRENLTIQTPNVSAPFAGLALFQDSFVTGDLRLIRGVQDLSLTAHQQFHVAGTLHWTGGLLTGNGSTTANGMNVGPSVARLDAHTLTLAPFAEAVATGRMDLVNNARFNISAGASYTHSGSAFAVFGGSGGTVLDNDGLLVKKTDTGSRAIDTFVENAGEIRAEAGTLVLSRGSTTTGQIKTLPGATIQFTGGNHELLPGSSLDADHVRLENGAVGQTRVRGSWKVTGSVTQQSGQPLTFENGATIVNYGPVYAIPGGTVNFNASVGGSTIHFDSFTIGTPPSTSGIAAFNSGDPVEIANLTHGPGTISGSSPITVTSSLVWRPGALFTGSGNINVNGSMTVEAGGGAKGLTDRAMNNAGGAVFLGNFSVTGSAQFNNLAGGTVDIRNDGTAMFYNGGTASNAGTLLRTTGAGTATIGPPVTNTGLIEVRTGTLAFEREFIQTSGETFLNGGNLSMIGAVPKPAQVLGGRVRGAGTVSGTVQNISGSVEPGASPGILTVTGTYTQSVGGTLRIELAGAAPGSGHDQLVVSGNAQLNGALAIEHLNGYLPSAEQQFVIVTAGSVQGAFTSVSGPGQYTVATTPTQAILTVVAPCSAFVGPDFDQDCDVDSADSDALVACASGASVPPGGGCAGKDLDTDGDVDADDFGILQRCFNGAGRGVAPQCDD